MKNLITTAIVTMLITVGTSAAETKLYTCSTPKQDKLIKLYRASTGSSSDAILKIEIISKNEDNETSILNTYKPQGHATPLWITFMENETRMGISLENIQLQNLKVFSLVGAIGKASFNNKIKLENSSPLVCSFELTEDKE